MSSKSYSMLLSAALAAGLSSSSANGQSMVDKAERDELAYVATNDPVMAAAIRKARATLPDFLALAKATASKAEGFSIKVAIREGNNAEYFWIYPFDNKDGQFSGVLNNTPRSVRKVKLGDKITFTEKEIVDWIYMDSGKMKGNYTACALRSKSSKQEFEAFKKRFGLDCDF
jgi:uncharacterized protein YegJ (DUF2314 family)